MAQIAALSESHHLVHSLSSYLYRDEWLSVHVFPETPVCAVQSSRPAHLYLQSKQHKLRLSSAISATGASVHVICVSSPQFAIDAFFKCV